MDSKHFHRRNARQKYRRNRLREEFFGYEDASSKSIFKKKRAFFLYEIYYI